MYSNTYKYLFINSNFNKDILRDNNLCDLVCYEILQAWHCHPHIASGQITLQFVTIADISALCIPRN